MNDLVRLPWPTPKQKENVISGEILYIDVFGNLFTNVRERDLTGFANKKIVVHLGSIEIRGLSLNYSEGESGNFIALINSWGLLEIARYRNNAATLTGTSIGDRVEIVLPG
jgi:S-adenosylmethionine hydrolase